MDTQQETILQAVILADPFEHQSRYGPLIRGGGQDGEGEDALPWVRRGRDHRVMPAAHSLQTRAMADVIQL